MPRIFSIGIDDARQNIRFDFFMITAGMPLHVLFSDLRALLLSFNSDNLLILQSCVFDINFSPRNVWLYTGPRRFFKAFQ